MSTVEVLHNQTRNHPVCQQLIPLESVFSFPVPFVRGNQVYMRFFIYQRGRGLKRGDPRPIYHPYAHLSVKYPSGDLVEYVDLYFAEGRPSSPAGEQVDKISVQGETILSFDDTIAQRSRLFGVIENIIPLLNEVALTFDKQLIIQEYNQLLDTLSEPGLRPFYEQLNPALFELVKKYHNS